MGFILPLVLRLMSGAFVGTLACVYVDKAFTSNKLARALDEQGCTAGTRIAIRNTLSPMFNVQHPVRQYRDGRNAAHNWPAKEGTAWLGALLAFPGNHQGRGH
eukprot:6697246-Prymnesium_polylepis.1